MKKISLAIMVLVVTLASCKKTPEVNLKYVDVERDLITVGMTTATVQCDYQYIATLKKAYLYYGEGSDSTNMNNAEMRVVQNTLYVDLADLKPNTLYSYYYEFYNGFNSMRTVVKTFKTESLPIALPTVVTSLVTEITTTSAKGGGEVTDDGGAEVTERGICWGTNENPTLNNSHIAVGMGIGAFTAMMDGLDANTTYHVRAYAINSAGTAYGLDREFTTLSGGGSGVPEGAINGLFTINANGDQVYFSQGNLQYQASTNTWRFAEHQWDYVGGDGGGIEDGNVFEDGVKCDNSLISSIYSGWIDLFGWGTSGYNHGAVCYQPWSISTNDFDYKAYGEDNCSLYNYTGQADWGYNAIANGGNHEHSGWRTLNRDEWGYIFNNRIGALSKYGHGQVNGVNGLIILPDELTEEIDFISGDCEWVDNVYSGEQWVQMEAIGAVFLPVTGSRNAYIFSMVSHSGHYWSSTFYTAVSSISFSSHTFNSQYEALDRYYGCSVRLVRNATP